MRPIKTFITVVTFLVGCVALVLFASAAQDFGTAALATGDAATALQFAAMVPVVMSPSQLEREAAKLSHFEGGRMNFYTGGDDDLLSFEGDIRSFAQELDKNLEKQFSVSVVNANAAARTALLYAGYLLANTTLAPGQLVEGAFNDTGGNAGLTGATLEQKSIQELNLFLNHCPTRLLALKIQSTVQGQLNNNLSYQRNNPFKTEETKIIRPKNFINQDTFQNDQVTFPVDVQLDALAKLSYPFIGTSTNYVTFYFGASLNIMEALEKKASRAGNNIRAVGKEAIIQATRNTKALGSGS